MSVRLTAALVLSAAMFLFLAAAAQAAPANDNFADAELLTGPPASTTGSNVDATTEVDEPDHNGNPAEGHSVWYKWVAPSTGPVTVDLSGSDYNTYLAVYTGTTLLSLSLVEDDYVSGVGSSSKLGFTATSAETYWIAVDGYDDRTGSIELSIFVPGSIIGTVTDESALPIDTACTVAYDSNGDGYSFGSTDSSGDYEIGNLAAGSYRIQFYNCSSGSNYLTEFYDDQPDFESAQQVAVTSGATKAGIDAEMVVAGSIQGTVKDSGANLLNGICVEAYDSGGSYRSFAQTDASGEYTVRDLDTGDYRLSFYRCGSPANVLGEYYENKQDLESADQISVVLGSDTTGINAELAVGGSISGNVTDELAGPLEDICIRAYSESGGGYVAGDQTDPAGDYTIVGLSTDNYMVQFYDCGSNDVISEYYNDKRERYLADPVAVVQGADTSGIDAELAPAGTISGTVADSNSDPLEDICVDAWNEEEGVGEGASTDSNGDYSIRGLEGLDYIVHFNDCGSNNVVAEFYDDQIFYGDADPVAVPTGAEISGIDAELATGGSISGTVVNKQGEPLEGICVDAIVVSGIGGSSEYSEDETDADGNYSLGGLRGGRYRASFWDCGGNNVIGEYYNNEIEFRRADPILVTTGVDTPSIDVEMLSTDDPPPDTAIDSGPSGSIKSNQATFTFHGVPEIDTEKVKCRIDGGTYFDCGSPKTFSGLSDGSHTVEFRAVGYAGNSDSTPASRSFTVNYAPCAAARSDLDKAKKKQKKAKKQKNKADKSLKKAKKTGNSSKVKRARKKLKKAKKNLKKANGQVKSGNKSVDMNCD